MKSQARKEEKAKAEAKTYIMELFQKHNSKIKSKKR